MSELLAMTLVFVYGTLKRNFPNFHINTGTRIDGIFCTKNHYPFYLVGGRYIPWLVLDEGKGHQVKGELYKVDQNTMDNMDILEAIGEPDGYQKVQLPIASINDITVGSEQEVLATVYMKMPSQLQSADIRLGPLKEYTAEHASLYRPRHL